MVKWTRVRNRLKISHVSFAGAFTHLGELVGAASEEKTPDASRQRRESADAHDFSLCRRQRENLSRSLFLAGSK